MSDINNNTIVGRATKDAELKYTNSGMAVTTISIANNYSRKQGDEWIEEVNYFDVKLWGRRAESLNQYLLKGTQIAVTGELRQERWEQDGNKRSRVIINASNIQLLGGKKGSQQNQQKSYGNNQQSNNQRQQEDYDPNKDKKHNNYPSGSQGNKFDDDIPY